MYYYLCCVINHSNNLKFIIMIHLIGRKIYDYNNNNFRVYAKFPGQSKYRPLDLAQGTQVNNLIHATIVPAEKLDKVKKLVELNNAFCLMQIRDLNNNIVF